MIINKLVVKAGTKCSLKCEKCGEFNPYLGENTFDFNLEYLSNDVFKIAKCVEHINTVHIAGGEPFLHPNLYLFVSYLSNIQNIGLIEIVTNGTVIPNEITLKLLLKLQRRIIVLVSDYSNADVNQKRVISLLEETGINHRVNKNMIWKDKSDTSFKNHDNDKLLSIAKNCITFRDDYFSLINGIVTAHCPTSGSLMYFLGYDMADGFFFNLRQTEDDNIGAELSKLLKHEYTPMCNWCVPTNEAPDCVAGGQLK
ncbi:MAG: hypothetical protein FWD34_01830 [Oscillospiraceae bacterium]|nr:hypothetical protein [Oscillospiraceae bacterium]